MNCLRIPLQCVIGLLAIKAAADPVNLRDISPDSAWFAHFDGTLIEKTRFASASEAKFGKDFSGEYGERNWISFDEIPIGEDDFSGITIYGDASVDNLVMLCYHTLTPEQVSRVRAKVTAKAKPGATTVVDGVTVISIDDHDKEGPVVYHLNLNDTGPFVVSRNAHTTARAVKGLGGKGFPESDEFSMKQSGPNSMILGHVNFMKLPIERVNFEPLKSGKSATYTLTERGDNLVSSVRLVMADTDSAEKIHLMVQGFQYTLDDLKRGGTVSEDVVRMLKNLRCSVTGKTLSAEMPVLIPDAIDSLAKIFPHKGKPDAPKASAK